MIYIIIDGYRYEHFNNVAINLVFGSIASTFSIDVLAEYDNVNSRRLMTPLKYYTVEIYVYNQLILTGTILNHAFKLSSTKNLVTIAGYSKTGVLEDCSISAANYPLEFENMKLSDIVSKLVEPFGISVVYQESADQFSNVTLPDFGDRDVAGNLEAYEDIADIIDQDVPSSSVDESEKVGAYLAKICKQMGMILSHTAKGELLIARADSLQEPIQRFGNERDSVEITLTVDGQSMFSETDVIRQQFIEEGDSGGPSAVNPYVIAYRPNTAKITDGESSLEVSLGRTEIGKQLNGIKLSIATSDIIWAKDRKLMTPGKIITVQSKELFLEKETKFFVDSISYKLGVDQPTAVLKCVLPEVYNQKTITPIW